MKKVYLVGAGPGDPGLITTRGLELLKQADVVIYDYLVDKRLLDHAKDDAELICCDTLEKKRYSDGFLRNQGKINRLVINKTKEGKKVVRLKNGDPSVFGRLSEEIDALVKNNIEFEIVPGVTAASAVGAAAGVPLTNRRFSSSVVFVTGHEAEDKRETGIDWEAIARCGTIAFYMAVENISGIAKKLISAGMPKDTPVVAVSSAGTVNQKVLKIKLGDLSKEKRINPPAVFIVTKKIGRLKKEKRILFTGLSKERFFLKGTYVHLPLIKIVPLADYAEFDGHLKNIWQFDWIVFTSRYGVEYFFRRLKTKGNDVRILSNIKIAVIGNSTREHLGDFGISADLVPKEESSNGLLTAFKGEELRDKRIFLPRSDISDKGLEEGLRSLGALVTSTFAYRNVMPDNLPDIDLGLFNEIVFTSPSGVRNFVKRYGVPKKIKIRYIGDVTRIEAERWNLKD